MITCQQLSINILELSLYQSMTDIRKSIWFSNTWQNYLPLLYHNLREMTNKPWANLDSPSQKFVDVLDNISGILKLMLSSWKVFSTKGCHPKIALEHMSVCDTNSLCEFSAKKLHSMLYIQRSHHNVSSKQLIEHFYSNSNKKL